MARKAENLIVVVVVLALCAASASAEIVTIKLEGEVTYVHPYNQWLIENFSIGDVVEGWYKYDTDASDTNPLKTVGSYHYSTEPYGISLSVGEDEIIFKTDPEHVDFTLSIFNDFPEDRYYIASERNLPVSGVTIAYICWQLDDSSATVFSSTAIPTEPPPIPGDWDFRRLSILVGPRGGQPGLDVKVTRAIPEPAALLLIGLGSLFIFRRRKS